MYKMEQEGLKKALTAFGNAVSNAVSNDTLTSLTEFANGIGAMILKIQSSDFMKDFHYAMCSFCKEIEEAINDPESYHSFQRYEEKLKAFHWAWPYGIQPDEMKRLIEDSDSEEEFDRIMLSFFTEERMDALFAFIKETIPERQKCLISQIEKAYREEQYALINIAVMSIIDNLFIEIPVRKRQTTRKGILQPIINFYRKTYGAFSTKFLFQLTMLSNNIDLVFTDYDFSEDPSLKSNKKARRHLTMHGVMYSNKKEDSVMLLNTVAAVLSNTEYIRPFERALIYKNKRFNIATSEAVLKNRIDNQLHIPDNLTYLFEVLNRNDNQANNTRGKDSYGRNN